MNTLTGHGRVLTGDIEAVGLLPDIREGHREDIHIIHLKDMETGETFDFFDDYEDRIDAVWLDEFEEGHKQGDILEGRDWMQECAVLVFQNISGFDAIALEKTVGFKRNHFQAINHEMFPFKTADTYNMSTVLNPERKLHPSAYVLGLGRTGPHSIAAHGIRMGRQKPEHEDWSHLSKDMIHRCAEDVEIGEDMFLYLMKEWDEQIGRPNKQTGKDISHAYWCELRMAFTVARQAQRGFAIDVEFISKLIPELDEQIQSTIDGFKPHMPLRLKMKKLPETQVNKNVDAIPDIQASYDYENYMVNGDGRASYAATNWNITKKNGEYGKNVTKYVPSARGFMQDHAKPPVSGPFTPLVWEEIPLGNRDAVKQILFKHGWIGVNYNDTELEYIEDNETIPVPWAGKIDDDSLLKWEESEKAVPPWCKNIAKWYVLNSRRTQILNSKDPAIYDVNKVWPKQTNGKHGCRGILPKARCFDEGEWKGRTAEEFYEGTGAWPTSGHWRVPAEAFSCATNTFRMRHKCVVNIPSRGLYGKEMRRVFIPGPGKMLLGCDGAGLELRMLAHFMNDLEYTAIILSGDIHSFNQKMAGLPSRDMAKTFIYAFLYGSGIDNLARQLGLPFHQMEEAIAKFKRDLPKLASLIDRVQEAGKRFGYLLSVDGRWGRIRSKGKTLSLHTALNVLLQMTGSLVMKWAHVHAEDLCVQDGLIASIDDFPIVAHVHDEMQAEVDRDEVEEMVYRIEPDAWKKEEKRQHFDDQGRMWSAAKKIGEDEDGLMIRRYYHAIGENYCKALTWAGEELGLRCPTAGEYLIGESWVDTH